jgi:multidrug efflux pump subunit AcrB
MQVAAGQIGQEPVPKGQQFQLTINTLGRLTDPEQFGDIILKAGDRPVPAPAAEGAGNGQASQNSPVTSTSPADTAAQAPGIVRLRHVARVELGARQYEQSCTLDGKPSVALSIYQLPGSNALSTARGVYARMDELKTRFPEGLDYRIVYDTTPFIQESVNEVFKTLRDAVILVGIVVLLFLQDWKAMILPMIDVPVSLIGTFAVMAALGFSLNNLTLFGLVLAIGIVVDDAIVVLENIERLIATGLDARTATIKAMEEITGPVLAITLVLSSVFVPCGFLGGITGQFFRQFAVTIAASTIISAVNALTMTPSRAVLIFKTEEGAHGHVHQREALPWWIFGVLGGVLTVWLGQRFLSHPSWAAMALLAVPGALTGGLIGWFVITPVNATKCMALGVAVRELFNTLQVYLGSYYVNNFNEFGRTWQVNVQADPRFRGDAPDIRALQVRNDQGQMIRLATLIDVRNTSGPVLVQRYNLYSGAAITGSAAPGTSSGAAMALMEQLAREQLPQTMAYDWTELALMQRQAGNTAVGVFALAVVFVFLVLAAQYESWKLPLAVILVVPMCLLCSVAGVELAGSDVNLFTQIGFVVLVGLASKNAILIVEFAKQHQEQGVAPRAAVLEASRLRLRPILMTSFAFLFGVLPLVIAQGAGAEMRQSLGRAVFSGMLGVTLFGIVLTPVFFDVIQRFGSRAQGGSVRAGAGV